MSKSSQTTETDWQRVKREADTDVSIPYSFEDGPYNPNKAADVDQFLSQAKIRRRGERGPQKTLTKEAISIRLSRDVVMYFRSTGEGWQSRIDEILANWVKRHSK